MNGVESNGIRRKLPWWRRRWFHIVAGLAVAGCLAVFLAAEYVLHHAQPIIRKRIIETLSDRFHAPVQLDRIDISLLRGIQVNGWGLRIAYSAGTVALTPDHPMIAVQHFAFRTSIRGLLHKPTHVAQIQIEGMALFIPPGREHDEPQTAKHHREKVDFVVQELQCRDVKLFIQSDKPGPDHRHKPPLEFDIASLRMRDVGRDQAMFYDAQIINPKPIGAIHAIGHFGPWANGIDGGEPGDTPLDGRYSFDHADLDTIKGIGGTLSSTGSFAGQLDRIAVDGETDTPNFSLDISEHPMPLHTVFHAIVNGQDGDTYLQPVHARLGGSEFTTSGKIVKIEGKGHDIDLDVQIPHGRVQDFLRLAVKTTPPLMDGTLTMHAQLHIPAGPERVPAKLGLKGAFALAGVQFNNLKMQNRIDGLSARAQGKPNEVDEVSHDRQAEADSRISANVSIGHGVMEVTGLRYAIPGATVLLNGVYSMDGRLFEFRGHVRTEATASQMVGGWKGFLLKPLDPFLEKHGAGLELPIEVSGTEGDVHFGLAMHDANDTPAQMLSDVKAKDHAKREMDAARREAAQADAEDLQASRATTLEEAQRAHAAAVRHRADAQARAQAAQRDTAATEPRPQR